MNLGDLSAKYESNGDPGAVSSGESDAGGVSYGAYQFATNAGIPAEFVRWLQEKNYLFSEQLAIAGKAGTHEFTAAWLSIADNYSSEFLNAQHDFVRQTYYEPAVERVRATGIEVEARSFALQNVVWSAAVQYGPYYVKDLFEAAAAKLGLTPTEADDAVLIQAIYDIRASDEWTAGSPELRPGLIARFEAECSDALAMLT